MYIHIVSVLSMWMHTGLADILTNDTMQVIQHGVMFSGVVLPWAQLNDPRRRFFLHVTNNQPSKGDPTPGGEAEKRAGVFVYV